MNKPLNIVIRPEDYRYGDGHIQPKLRGITTTDWGSHFEFNVWQTVAGGQDTDDCWDFGGIKNVDAFMDALIPVMPISVTQQITDWGFMDTGIDGQLHFHSSPRFPGVLTGIGQNGGGVTTELDFAKTYGLVPFTMLPITQSMTLAEYFDPTAITQEMKDLALKFRNLMGGKDFILYQWIVDGGATNVPKMAEAQPLGPFSLGIPVNDGWNQVHPTVATGSPQHVVSGYDVQNGSVLISDNYSPFNKILDPGYQISYVLQIIVQYLPPPPPPPAPPAPTQPTVQNTVSWLQALSAWLSNLLESITLTGRQKLGGASRSSKWPAFKKEYAKTHPPICAITGSKKNLNLHHLKCFHAFPELELDPDNVVWLEEKVHLEIGHLGNFQSINPTGREDIKLWAEKVKTRPMTVEDIKKAFSAVENKS